MGDDIKNENILPVSYLGKKEHWDTVYKNELQNLIVNGVQPEGWFGPQIIEKMISYLTRNSMKSEAILDLGCGNGDTIIRLVELGWENLTGFDYSEHAVRLCEKLFSMPGFSDSDVSVKVVDLVNMKEEDYLKKYNVCLDKGTYDAICLNPEISVLSIVRDQYWANVHKLLEDEGYFIIASCNWTAKEVTDQASKWFMLKTTIPTCVFSYGGSSGESTSICVFTKKLH